MTPWPHRWREVVWMDSIPSLLGLALRAGRLAVGEEPGRGRLPVPQGVPVAAGQRRGGQHHPPALHFCQAGKTICITLPLTKQELGPAGLGRASCAMLALTDVGFAAAVAGKAGPAGPRGLWPRLGDLVQQGRPGQETPRGKALPPQKQGRAPGRKTKAGRPIQRRQPREWISAVPILCR